VLTVPGDQVADLVTALGETIRGRVVVVSTDSLHPDATCCARPGPPASGP
jgi:hypothetical protein